jgi:hypothetical protein
MRKVHFGGKDTINNQIRNKDEKICRLCRVLTTLLKTVQLRAGYFSVKRPISEFLCIFAAN